MKFKQSFIANVVQKSLGEQSCIFEEMAGLPSGQGACAAHGGHCALPRNANIFVCGFSCKDLSRLSSRFNGAERESILKMGMGTSGGTFQAVLGYTKLVRPAIVILENVDEMSRESSPNVMYLHQAFADIDYAGASKVLNTSDYGLPQARVRAWFVILDLRRFGCTAPEAQAMARTMLSRTELFKSSPRPLGSMCLKDADPRLQSELARRQESAKGDSSASSTWFETHRIFLKTKGLSWQEVVPPKTLQENPWFKVLPSREEQVLSYALQYAGGNVTSADISQRIDRVSLGRDGVLPTITPHNKTWLVEQGRPLTGFEALGLQGFPMDILSSSEHCPSDPQLMDLAGNAFSGPVVMAVLVCMFAGLGDLADRIQGDSPRSMQSMDEVVQMTSDW